MRALAAQMRCHASATALEMYRRKFKDIASELEEAALVAENRKGFPLVS